MRCAQCDQKRALIACLAITLALASDLAARLDWYANRYVRWSVTGQYNVLNRFIRGAAEYSEQRETGGAVARSIRERRTGFEEAP